MPFDYVIMIPTHNRAKLLEPILAQLRIEAMQGQFKIRALVIDDYSDEEQNYSEIIRRSNHVPAFTIDYHRFNKNFGLKQYYRVINFLLSKASRLNFKYAIMLSDDLRLCKSFIKRVTKQFDFSKRQNKNVVCVNIMPLFPKNWGYDEFIDGAFIANKTFFKTLNWEIFAVPPRRWERNHTVSSGVWRQVTFRIRKSNYKIDRVSGISYVRPVENVPSEMFPEKQFPNRAPVTRRRRCNFIDDLE